MTYLTPFDEWDLDSLNGARLGQLFDFCREYAGVADVGRLYRLLQLKYLYGVEGQSLDLAIDKALERAMLVVLSRSGSDVQIAAKTASPLEEQ